MACISRVPGQTPRPPINMLSHEKAHMHARSCDRRQLSCSHRLCAHHATIAISLSAMTSLIDTHTRSKHHRFHVAARTILVNKRAAKTHKTLKQINACASARDCGTRNSDGARGLYGSKKKRCRSVVDDDDDVDGFVEKCNEQSVATQSHPPTTTATTATTATTTTMMLVVVMMMMKASHAGHSTKYIYLCRPYTYT